MSNYDEYHKREEAYRRKALELVGPQHLLFNIAPIIQLVREADALGLDLVKRAPSKEETGR